MISSGSSSIDSEGPGGRPAAPSGPPVQRGAALSNDDNNDK